VTSDVRFGGREVGGVFRFELTGGALALDFVNTLDERETEPKELLADYGRLLEWSEQAGALSGRDCRRLKKVAELDPRKANTVLLQAREIRETLFAVVANLVRGDLKTHDLDALNRWIRKAGARRRLSYSDGHIFLSHGDSGAELSAMLWPIIDSAGDLFTNSHLRSRIKICEGEGCGWAFLDNSRQGNKRWCDMTVCGNRAKAKRHRLRQANRQCSGKDASSSREAAD
jgi:predicted RNA-binding Zn ribbon-like protein